MFFSDLRARRLQRTEVTEAGCEELKSEISKLQKQLHQIVEQEITSNNDAYGVATNGVVQLHNELEKLTMERSRLKNELRRKADSLKGLERQCEEELDSRRKCQEDITRLRSSMELAKTESNTLRAEINQLNYFQEQVDKETYFRLKADLQNLEIDKDRDIIRLRQLKLERRELETVLSQLAKERDAFHVIAQKSAKELQDENMTHDMYKAHQETLHEHAERLGVFRKNELYDRLSSENLISSFNGFFNRRACNDSSGQKPIMNVSANKCNTIKSVCEKMKEDNSSPSDKSPDVAAVGCVTYTDSVPSSDFFRKTPKIFKLGGGSSRSNDIFVHATTNEEREISINKDESSAHSSITMSDEELTLELSREDKV